MEAKQNKTKLKILFKMSGEKNFSFTLLCFVSRLCELSLPKNSPLKTKQNKTTKQNQKQKYGGNQYRFIYVFICTGVHSKEVKFKVFRCESIYTLLIKERGFGLQRTVKCEEVLRKHIGELREDLSCSSKVCLNRFIIFTSKECCSHLIQEVGEMHATLTKENLCPTSRQIRVGGGREVFPYRLILNCFQLKIIFCLFWYSIRDPL